MISKNKMICAGSMTGTSLDGIDVAQITTDGHSISEFGPIFFRPFSNTEKSSLSAAMGKWPEDHNLLVAREIIHKSHLDAFQKFPEAKILGFHGQTLAHDPKGRGTHQLGDGSFLAKNLKKPVVWDFRSSDIKNGGEGAPLAPFFHFACAKFIKAKKPIAILNLGGVANITWVDPEKSFPQEKGALIAFDTGPANAPLNDFMLERRGLEMDENGSLAYKGRVNNALLELFLTDEFFKKKPPKSLDRNYFRKNLSLVSQLPDEDAIATLSALVAQIISDSFKYFPSYPEKVLVTGGGRKNLFIVNYIKKAVKCPVYPIEEVGLNGDMLEAQSFAFLAARVFRSLPTTSRWTTGVTRFNSGGILSFPTGNLLQKY